MSPVSHLFLLRLGLIGGVGVGLLAWSGCSAPMTEARLREIAPGTPLTEVERQLGAPQAIERSETTGWRGLVYRYASPQGEGRVVFLNESVFTTEWVAQRLPP